MPLGVTPRFPAGRAEKRAALLAAVEAVRPVLEAHLDDNEELGTLHPECVEALRASGLVTLKLPAELGGAEADPVVQMDVIEAVTLIDPAAAWCMFIAGAVTGNAASRLPDDAVAEMFAGGRFPLMAGTLKPSGTATRVEGGYRCTGRWAWGSGVRHADYVAALLFADEPQTVISATVPIAEVEVHDTWHVLGMKGTGSTDYSLDDVFVPDAFVSDMAVPAQRRGGALYRLGMPGFVVNEHASFAIGLARRALLATAELAASKKRGYLAVTTIADRAVVQRAVGEGDLRLTAVRALMVDVLDRLFASAAEGPAPADLQAEARAAAVLATDESLAVVSAMFRHAGGTAVFLQHVLQRCLRDLYVAQSHYVVSDVAYEEHGRLVLERAGGTS